MGLSGIRPQLTSHHLPPLPKKEAANWRAESPSPTSPLGLLRKARASSCSIDYRKAKLLAARCPSALGTSRSVCKTVSAVSNCDAASKTSAIAVQGPPVMAKRPPQEAPPHPPPLPQTLREGHITSSQSWAGHLVANRRRYRERNNGDKDFITSWRLRKRRIGQLRQIILIYAGIVRLGVFMVVRSPSSRRPGRLGRQNGGGRRPKPRGKEHHHDVRPARQ